MFSIGDFAALDRVSVRMLRHYDTGDVILKSIPPIRIAQLAAPAAGYDGPESAPCSRRSTPS